MKKKKNTQSLDSFSSIILFNEIPEPVMVKVLRKLKQKILVFKANLFDLSKEFSSDEFLKHLNSQEEIIFDEDFFKECEQKNIKNIEEIEKYKKTFIKKIIKDIEMKQICKKHLLRNYSEDKYLKLVKNTVLSFNYTYEDFKKSLEILISRNE